MPQDPPAKTVKLGTITADYRQLLTQWLEKMTADDSFEIEDLESGEQELNERLDNLLDQDEWSADDALELSALFFICAFLTESDL